jgi:hypothetical protein
MVKGSVTVADSAIQHKSTPALRPRWDLVLKTIVRTAWSALLTEKKRMISEPFSPWIGITSLEGESESKLVEPRLKLNRERGGNRVGNNLDHTKARDKSMVDRTVRNQSTSAHEWEKGKRIPTRCQPTHRHLCCEAHGRHCEKNIKPEEKESCGVVVPTAISE